MRFAPTSANQGTGTLTLHSNDSCQPTRTVSLNATVPSPQITASSDSTVFPPTVVGCIESKTVTVSNTGAAALIVSPSVSGAGYSLSPFLSSGSDGIHLAPGDSAQLTVNFAPTSVARALTGTLTLTSNDPVNPIDTIDFCGEGAPTGIRVLVLQRTGIPYPSVDQIMLQGPSGNVTLKKVPLTVINPPGSCEPTQFHYEAAIPVNDFEEEGVQRNKKKNGHGYTLHIKIKNKHQTINISLGSCDFQQLVITI